MVDETKESDIMALADLFCVRNRPQAFRVLPCLGLIKVEQNRRFGFVFQPPSYIEQMDAQDIARRGTSAPRLPQTLRQRIHVDSFGNKPVMVPLGDRFNLARKLARSLYVMHTAGWLHKKYVCFN